MKVHFISTSRNSIFGKIESQNAQNQSDCMILKSVMSQEKLDESV